MIDIVPRHVWTSIILQECVPGPFIPELSSTEGRTVMHRHLSADMSTIQDEVDYSPLGCPLLCLLRTSRFERQRQPSAFMVCRTRRPEDDLHDLNPGKPIDTPPKVYFHLRSWIENIRIPRVEVACRMVIWDYDDLSQISASDSVPENN